MLSAQDNETITRTGPGTPCGDVLRAAWQPVALVDELPVERPAKAVRLLGEDLVLWRNPDDGGFGLVGRWCSHRGVDLAYGRLEGGGLRCLYHGWLYDTAGHCLEQPAEPEGSRFHEKIRHVAYPAVERNGIVFGYLGGGDPPPLPPHDGLAAPSTHTFAFKGLWECNWLQGLEGGIDPSHVSFLHRFLQEDPRDVYGQQFREEVEGTDQSLSSLVGERFRPDIDVEATDYGLRVFATRTLDDDRMHVRVTNLLFPNAFVIPLGNSQVITQWHVPIDDVTHHWFMILHDYAHETDQDVLRAQRLAGVTLPDYRSTRNRDNDWGFDASEQQSLTYTGMGLDINVHDQWAVESIGPIQDRTREHLGQSDRAVTAYRRMLLRAIDDHRAGHGVPGRDIAAPGPIAVDTVTPAEGWREAWQERDRARRDASPWAAVGATTGGRA